MTLNPYAAPSTTEPPLMVSPLGDRYQYRSNSTLATVLTLLLGAQIMGMSGILLMEILEIGFNQGVLFDLDSQDRVADAELWSSVIAGLAGLSLLIYFPAFIATIVMYCIWLYRSNRNSRALGAEQMEYTPGWAVGYCFIPILNLLRPYQVVREIFATSDARATSTDWQEYKSSSLIGWWWTTWIATWIAERLDSRLQRLDTQVDPMLVAGVGVSSSILCIVAAVLCMRVVRVITRRQDKKFEMQTQPSSLAVAP